MPPGHRGRARGAPARGCISITRPALTGGSEPQRSGGGEGHYLWGGGLPGPQGYRMGAPAGGRGCLGGLQLGAPIWLRKAACAGGTYACTCTSPCVHSAAGPAPGWGSDGHGALWPWPRAHAPRGPRAWLSDGAALPVGPHFEGPGANPPFRGRDYN